MKLDKVAVGGTFDSLHLGHRMLLRRAFEVGRQVLIGVTTEEMAKATRNHPVDGYESRKDAVERLVERWGVADRATVVPIDDPYGPLLTDEGFDGIVVSAETAWRAEEINSLRKRRGLRPLLIVTLRMVLAEDEEPISSTRIRRGEIDAEGRLIRGR